MDDALAAMSALLEAKTLSHTLPSCIASSTFPVVSVPSEWSRSVWRAPRLISKLAHVKNNNMTTYDFSGVHRVKQIGFNNFKPSVSSLA